MEKKVLSFNEFINESYAIKINEQDSISGSSTKTVLVGASKSNTTSQSAVNKLKDSIEGLTIEGDLKKEGALFFTLIIFLFLMGLRPNLFLDLFLVDVLNILEHSKH